MSLAPFFGAFLVGCIYVLAVYRDRPSNDSPVTDSDPETEIKQDKI